MCFCRNGSLLGLFSEFYGHSDQFQRFATDLQTFPFEYKRPVKLAAKSFSDDDAGLSMEVSLLGAGGEIEFRVKR